MTREVKSAVRTLEILEYLARAREPVALKDVVLELGFPKSSAHALLQTLVSRGYAARSGADRYVLDENLRQGPGWLDRSEAQIVAAARPVIESLRDALGETVFIGVRTNSGDVRRIEKCVSRHSIRSDTDRPEPAPGYCSAMGRVMLAHWNPAAVRRYLARVKMVAHSPQTVTDRRRLAAILAEIREQGYAVVDQEYVPGAVGIAAPVRNRTGAVVAVVDVGAVAQRYAAQPRAMIEGVKRAAAAISERLGHRASRRHG